MASTSRRTRNEEIGEWTRMEKLGEGGYGSLYIGKRNKDGKLFAVKSVYFVPRNSSKDKEKTLSDNFEAGEICKEECALSSLINEIRTLKKLKSAYVVRYIGCGTSKPPEMGSRLVLDCYLEYLPRGCLWNLVEASMTELGQALGEPLIKAYTKDILHGLVYLHCNKIVHGDLKCSNVLIDSTNCKIADFGSVKDVRTSFFKKILYGTIGYKAPEVRAKREQTYASDIFSLGCTIIFMATGESHSPGSTPHATSEGSDDDMATGESHSLDSTPHVTSERSGDEGRTQNYKSLDHIPKALSKQGQDFLSKCLAVDPSDRWSAADLLKQPFITEPSSPGWKPYEIPLDPEIEANLLKLDDPKGLTLIVRPDDVYSRGPISPIVTMPSRRRKIGACCQNLDETDVALPRFQRPVETPGLKAYTLGMVPAADKHSAVSAQAKNVRSPPHGISKPKRDTKKLRKPRPLAAEDAINRLKGERRRAHKSSESQGSSVSVTYQGHRLEIRTVAQLKGNDDDDDEDKDPLVVKICDEFGIPLPLEYQKWILDPDYDDPDVVANQGSTKDSILKNPSETFLRSGKKRLNLIFRRNNYTV